MCDVTRVASSVNLEQVNVFLAFSPFGRVIYLALHHINLYTIYLRMLCAKFGRNWPIAFREEHFTILSMYFVAISPWKMELPFILTNLKHLYPRMLCFKSGYDWTDSGSGEDENVKNLQTYK